MSRILTINGGSSSIKFALYAAGEPPRRLLSGLIERVGQAEAGLIAKDDKGTSQRHPFAAADHAQAGAALIHWLTHRGGFEEVAAVGHRVVHGGPRYRDPQRVTPELLDELRRLIPLDPAHLPGEIALIEAFQQHCPNLPQIACFDTAFHRDMPRVAQMLPIPRHYDDQGIQRFGFHGLSYTYLLEELERIAGRQAAQGRLVMAHLGAGASMAAIRDGKCLDTTMGFTPTSGLVMGTRTGDLDPGVLVHLLRTEQLNADQLDELVNRRSGLLGVSEISSDMRDLLSRQAGDRRAAEAVELFCYRAKMWIGALATVLGGLDTLIFSGGIGENAAEVRARICAGLDFLGIHLDPDRNTANAPIISTDTSMAVVRVIRTDEEWMIAQSVGRLLANEQTPKG
ncbi:MAG TPA: acetate/propionate family kinase [Gemmataceae bacterium]|nr:acetate/propionate family kinase [Gemmataceae bacterium]